VAQVVENACPEFKPQYYPPPAHTHNPPSDKQLKALRLCQRKYLACVQTENNEYRLSGHLTSLLLITLLRHLSLAPQRNPKMEKSKKQSLA
jgi:hypothetical protein